MMLNILQKFVINFGMAYYLNVNSVCVKLGYQYYKIAS
jgi:hypothetical protein